ncbi:MAG: RsiV family protein [Rhodanobacteraceae bacterium]
MKSSASKCLAAALAVAGLAACQQQSGPAPASNTPPVPTNSAPVISAPPAPAGTANLPGDHAATKHYKIAIDLPPLPASEKPLTAALRATADNAKREFMKALPDPQQYPEFANRQLQLLLKFQIAANTAAFTSVRETGSEDTGGAHPIPVEATFVYDRKANQVIALDDLFTKPDAARKTLANFAHAALEKKLMTQAPKPGEGSRKAISEWKTNMLQMLDDGTRPTTVNFSLFVVRQGSDKNAASPGLTLVFPPYQVAPYVYGTQAVEVPAKVFATFLKPVYQGAFAAH